MSGQDLRQKMLEKARASNLRPIQEHEKVFLNFIATYITDDKSQEVLYSMMIDCAFRIFFVSAVAHFPNEISLRPNDIKDFLKQKTFLPDGDIDRIQQLLKGALSVRYSPRPKNERKKRLFAKSSGNCYLCGLIVAGDDESEFDHVWPHSIGGNNSAENLKLAHAECAAIKADAATLADMLIGGIAYGAPPTALNLPAQQLDFWPHEIANKEAFNSYRRNIVASNFRLAVFMKQSYKCGVCALPFSEIGEAHLVNSEESLEWSVLNVRAFCTSCFNSSKTLRKNEND